MWKTIGCAVQGRGHEKENLPCQDQLAFAEGGGIAVAALADGAGSAREAEAGAQCAARTAADYVLAHFHGMIAEDDAAAVKATLLATLRGALEERRGELGCKLPDLASTLLVAAADDHDLLLLHLGDGVIGFLKDGAMHVASAPDNGEFANVTTFVTSPDAYDHLRIYRGDAAGIEGFVLMSDGAEQSFYQKQQQRLMPRLAHVLRSAALLAPDVFGPQLGSVMETAVRARTQDDCSIALLARSLHEDDPLAGKSDTERMHLYGFSSHDRCARRRLALFDRIYAFLAEPQTVYDVRRMLRLPQLCAARKKLDQLAALGLITKRDGRYQRACAPAGD